MISFKNAETMLMTWIGRNPVSVSLIAFVFGLSGTVRVFGGGGGAVKRATVF